MAYNSKLSTPQIEQALGAALLQEKGQYNITQDKGANYATLSEAIAAVSDDKYKVKGIVLTYNTGTEWVSKRYNGEDAGGFADEGNWTSVSLEADDEDIEQVNGLAKFKDRKYDEANFSGKGYKILRKNIQEVSVPEFDLTITNGCTSDGNITVTVGEEPVEIPVTTAAATAENVAALIGAAVPDVTVEGAVVTFKSNPTVDYSTTGVTGEVADNTYTENRNVLTQEMINEANTVYEIRYDFDLNGAEITVPEGCVLKFEGGILSNGILTGNNYEINAFKIKIFSNILFTGNAANNILFKVDWFVSKFVDNIYDDVNIDSSVELNQALNSGIKRIMFSNDKFYYLKNSIVVDGDIHLYSENDNRVYDSIYKNNIGHLPCIYSNEIVTLLDYRFSSDSYRGLTIGSINFYCRKPFTDLSESDIPVVKISANRTILWGLTFNANIKGLDRKIVIENIDKSFVTYTGLLLYSEKEAITFIKINGYIQMVYTAIETKIGDGWLTDLTINGDTRAVFGGKFNGGQPIRIFGSHQPIVSLPDITRGKGYFEGEWINLYGFIWDINRSDGELKAIEFPIRITSARGLYNNPLGNISIKREPVSYIRNSSDSWLNLSPDNLLDTLISVNKYNFFETFSYTINDESIFELSEGVLYNSDNLFSTKSRPFYHLLNANQQVNSRNAYIYFDKAIDKTLIIDLVLKKSSLSYRETQCVQIMFNASTAANLLIEAIKSDDSIEKIVDFTSNDNDATYIDSMYSTQLIDMGVLEATKLHIRLKQQITTTAAKYVTLPILYIPATRQLSIINGGDIRPKIPTGKISEQFYDTNIKKYIYFDGYWKDINGINADLLTKGTTEQRPTPTLTDEGFEYYDSTLKKKILWNGSDWVNMDGTAL